MGSEVLNGLVGAISDASVDVIDLTETLTEEFPTIELPPEYAAASGFRKKEVSRYDERGTAWYWNDITLNEHTGTHFDAPIHWVSGKDIANGSVDTLDPKNFIAPAIVVDCTREVAADKGFILTKQFLLDWEEKNGKIPAGHWLLMRSDWRKIADAKNYQNMAEDGGHSPGPDPEAVRFMIEERDVFGFGTECIGTDAGQAFAFDPPYPCHTLMHGAGKYGLQCLTNLDLLPARGAVILAAPLKIEDGSGSPLRVLALTGQ